MDVDITCPQCHQLDGVQSVPAICADGSSSSYDTGTYTGVGISSTGLVPVVGTTTIERSHSTALARSFTGNPTQKPTVGLTLVAIALLLLTALMLAIAVTTKMYPHPDDHPLSPIVAAVFLVGIPGVPGLVALHAVYTRMRQNSRIARGRPRAMAVWSAGWYCHRCYLAFWPYSPLPEIPARRGVTPDQFRWLVSKAGGYLNR